MILDLLVKPWVAKDYAKALEKEKEIGYKLKLNKLTPNWIDGQMVFDMTSIWQSAGIKAKGVNYFTIGAVKNDYSSRFAYKSPYYQAWLGGYIVKFSKSRRWSINDHFELGVADQKAWLSQYGDPNPYAKIDLNNIKKHKPIKAGGYKAELFEGSIYSHTDVGKGKKPLLFPLFMTGFAQTINKSNQSLNLKAKNLIPPKWAKNLPVKSFQKIQLHGFIAIISITRYIKAVIYSNGVIFKDNKGKNYNTFKEIKPELKKLIQLVQIVK